jgi:hypothetical protein
VVVQLIQLGLNGRLLFGEFTSSLRSPALGVNLLSVGPRLLPLLTGLLSIRRRLGV